MDMGTGGRSRWSTIRACPYLQISVFAANGYRKSGQLMGCEFLEAQLMQTAIGIGSKAFPAQMGVRILLLSASDGGPTESRLAGCGGHVDVAGALDVALSRLSRDPIGYDLFVMECDGFGGISGGVHAVSSLVAAEAKMRVMLLSEEFEAPALPFGRRAAVCLPVAAGEEEFRKGYQHVLRDRSPLPIM
jgi:hypothetical protein